jgi:hypothetical protein
MRSDTRSYLDPYYLAMSPGGGIRFHIEDLSGSVTHGTDLDIGPIPLQQWKHVAAVFDGSAGVMQLFIDGTLAGQVYTAMKPFRDLDPAYSPDVQIGNASGFNQVFNGLIDELAVYDRALSSAEVMAIYSAGSAGKCQPPVISVQPASQLGFWGRSVGFSVVARGEPPLSYQWSFAGSAIPGGTDTSLVLTNLEMTNAGIYQVGVTNAYGSVTSKPAVLTINSAGVSIALHAGVMIDGVVGLTYGIQYTSDLGDTNSWRGVANVTLTVPTQIWYDAQPAVQPTRYYRVVPGPISIP